jgi:hypothetical protein
MKTCPNCNTKLQDNDQLCMYCGIKFNSVNDKTDIIDRNNQKNNINLEKLNDYANQYNSPEYEKIIINGNKILIKGIFKSQKATISQMLMIVEIDGIEKKIYPKFEGDYILIQGNTGRFYQGPLLIAIVKKNVTTTVPTAIRATIKTSPVNTTESPELNLPKYQYWLLISSWIFSFTYIAPIIGIIASYVAYSDIEASSHKDKESQMGLTIGAGVLHAFFILLGIYSNGGF